MSESTLYQKAQALAIKLDSFSTERCRIDASPDEVLEKFNRTEINFYYERMCKNVQRMQKYPLQTSMPECKL